MTSGRKQDANSINAQNSTGPRSSRGKSISRSNAVKHGLSGKLLFLNPGHDDDERKRFDELLRDLTTELAPVGVLENKLVGRITECFIRLERAALCETGEIRKALEGFTIRKVLEDIDRRDAALITLARRIVDAEGGAEPIPDLTQRERRYEKEENARRILMQSSIGVTYLISTLDRIGNSADSGNISSAEITILGVLFGTTIEGPAVNILSAILHGRSEPKLAKEISLTPDQREKTIAAIENNQKTLRLRLEALRTCEQSEDEATKLSAVLPERTPLERVVRYQSSIDRQLYRALAQLERLQRARAGEFIPPPIKVSVDA